MARITQLDVDPITVDVALRPVVPPAKADSNVRRLTLI